MDYEMMDKEECMKIIKTVYDTVKKASASGSEYRCRQACDNLTILLASPMFREAKYNG